MTVFERAEVLERERNWPRLQQEILTEWVALRANFPPKGRTYQLSDASRFMRNATRQHIAIRAPEWASDLREAARLLE